VTELDALSPPVKTPLDYFMLMCGDWLQATVVHTHRAMRAADDKSKDFTEAEFKKWLGVRLLLTLHASVPLERMFKTKDDMFPDLTKYFSLKRFKLIGQHLTFGPVSTNNITRSSWDNLMPLVQSFNRKMQQVYTAGDTLTVDESMCGWLGKNGLWRLLGMVGVIKIQRKPVGIGLEFHNCLAYVSHP
jgi:hypothetical protein